MHIESAKPTTYSTALPANEPAQGPDGMFQGDTYERQGRFGPFVTPISLCTTGLVCIKFVCLGATIGLPVSSTLDSRKNNEIGSTFNDCKASFLKTYHDVATSF